LVKGDQIWVAYAPGPQNRIQSFRSTNVSTETDKPPAKAGQPVPPPAFTQSKEMLATFNPATGDLARVDQKTDFRYQEGDRQAHAETAMLDQQTNMMTLDRGARVWDPTGSTSADHMVMDQKTGDFTAEGHVASLKQPEAQAKPSAMLSNDEIRQAQAQKMVSTNKNKKVHYEGNAVAWQGANRVNADKLDMDSEHHTMEADGNVVSQFVDRPKDEKPADSKAADSKKDAKAAPKSAAPPVNTVVKAAHMLYTDDSRVAYYKGGVALTRGATLNVKSTELRAFFKDADSSLDKTVADGAVTIVDRRAAAGTIPARTRTGTGEHAEYFADDQKSILTGGKPKMVDSLNNNTTTGKQLTWWANNDRLQVDGSESTPAKSTIHKK
jgi:lipopolysaccharide export system protein LptA